MKRFAITSPETGFIYDIVNAQDDYAALLAMDQRNHEGGYDYVSVETHFCADFLVREVPAGFRLQVDGGNETDIEAVRNFPIVDSFMRLTAC